jgi:hypothetical protein
VTRKYFTVLSFVYSLDIRKAKISFYDLCRKFFELLNLNLSKIRQNLYCQRLLLAHFLRNKPIWTVLLRHIQANIMQSASVRQIFYLRHIKWRHLFDVDFDLPIRIQHQGINKRKFLGYRPKETLKTE